MQTIKLNAIILSELIQAIHCLIFAKIKFLSQRPLIIIRINENKILFREVMSCDIFLKEILRSCPQKDSSMPTEG